MEEDKPDTVLKCSFCSKRASEVAKLIAGPGVYICDECVKTCNEILDNENRRLQTGPISFLSRLLRRLRSAAIR